MKSNFDYYKIAWFICLSFVILTLSCTTSRTSNPDINTFKPDAFHIAVKPLLADIDNLGRIYVVDTKNRIINYKPDLTEQYRFADKKSGLISGIDVSNPLRIVIFYDDFNKVKILDNTLSIISELDLSDKFADISACSVTNDGNLWVYDPVQFKLIKISDKGTKILESSNVNDVGMNGVHISDIHEKNNIVVLTDKDKGFYVFDNLGQYQFHFEARHIRHVHFDGRNVFYYTNTGLKRFAINFKEMIVLGIPIDTQKQGLKYVIYHNGDYYEINENGINVIKGNK
jgi:hypothetical protein